MQLNYERLLAHLQQNLAPIYLIQGDEPLLVQEACIAIRNQAKQLHFTEQIRLTIDPQFNWHTFTSQLQNFSLFNEQQLIELQLTANLNPEGARLLYEYAQQPSQDKTLVILSHKLTSAQLQSTWCRAIEKHGVIVSIWPITQAQMPGWLKQRLTSLGLKMTSEGLQLLADFCEGNLLAAQQLIEKIQLLASQDPIPLATIQQLINDDARFTVFDLIDTCLQGNAKQTLRIVNKLQVEEAEPALIVWSLARELRALINIAEQVKQGKTLSAALATQSANSKRNALLNKALQNTSLTLWYRLLMQTAELDKIIKGAAIGNIWQAIRALCLQFALRKYSFFT
ncbi:MAG: holA [Gammaproteobacteria bacterium]|jgi:DNA polymerase-3 subunit delta|nr:holA [Gammaproteobacteria bacterium]